MPTPPDPSNKAPPDATKPLINRRSFVRYPPNATISCRLDKWGMGKPVPAKLVDLSQGGACFTIGQELKSNSEFEVELEGIMTRKKVQVKARVVKAAARENGAWQVSCQFEKRLPFELLTCFVRMNK